MNRDRPDPQERCDANGSLDPARLADVLRASDLTAQAFVVEFRRSVDADVRELVDACALGDLVRVEQLAHRVQGASKFIGAEPMGQACSHIARAGRAGEVDALRSVIDVLLERKQALYACLNHFHPAAALAAVSGEGDGVCAGLVFLVVEDHEFQRGMIMRLLRQLGALEVQGYSDGASGLAAAREVPSRAIMVLDLAMPALGGIDVMQIVGQEQLDVSVIVNSALNEDMLHQPLEMARSHGVTILGAVSKPLTSAKLAPLLSLHRHDQGQEAHSRLCANDLGKLH